MNTAASPPQPGPRPGSRPWSADGPDHRQVPPEYADRSVLHLVPALLEGSCAPRWLDATVLSARQVVLLVLDGLGWQQLQRRLGSLPALAGLTGGPITTVAPSTTAAALTSISTGVAPGEHGVVGYRIAVDDGILNALRWSTGSGDARRRIDPRVFQPCTVFGGQWPPIVTRSVFAGSGFTEAHLRDTRFTGYDGRAGLIDEVVGLIGDGEPFVYAYWDAVDLTAHEFGLGERYDEELAACDAMVDALLARVGPGVALVVTADHGQVDVGDRMLDLPGEITGLIDSQSGEARFRWLHARPGAADDLAAACREAFDDVAWIPTVDEAIHAGWFGPTVTADARARLGDVALVAREPVGFNDPAEVMSIELIGRHGSLTAEEMLVPALAAVT